MIKEVRKLTVNNYSDIEVEYNEIKVSQEEFDGIQSKAMYFYSQENPKRMKNKKNNGGVKSLTG